MSKEKITIEFEYRSDSILATLIIDNTKVAGEIFYHGYTDLEGCNCPEELLISHLIDTSKVLKRK